MRTFLFILIYIISFYSHSFAQKKNAKWGLGVSGIYNFQTNSFGASFRGQIYLSKYFSVAPQASYFFSFNPIHEWYAGATVQYNFLTLNRFDAFVSGGLFYNNWINYTSFNVESKDAVNLAPEIGGGIAKNIGCVRPFAEYRYDVKWKECNIRLGVIFFFGDCLDKGNKHRKVSCPAYE